MKKVEKMRKKLNDNFRECLNEAFQNKFDGLQLETVWNFSSMNLVSYLANGEDLTEPQIAWIQCYSDGYRDAMVQISEGKEE